MKIQQNVVTYMAGGGMGNSAVRICPQCAARLRSVQLWPRHPANGEYCSVSHGLHAGTCDLCSGTGNVAPSSVLPDMAFRQVIP